MDSDLATAVYSRTEVIMDIWRSKSPKCFEDGFSQFSKFLEQLVTKPLIEFLSAQLLGVQL